MKHRERSWLATHSSHPFHIPRLDQVTLSSDRLTLSMLTQQCLRGRAGASPLAGVVVAVCKQMSRAHVHLRHDAVVVAHCQHPLQG